MTLKHGQKYNSFYDKIKDYQIRKLQLERNAEKNKMRGEYSKEYYALVKAKKDIKDKIKESIEGALVFSEIVRESGSSLIRSRGGKRFQYILEDSDLKKFDLTDDSVEVKEEIADEAKEFIRDTFNEEVIERLLNAIFFDRFLGEKEMPDEEHRNYMIDVAKKMATKAIGKLEDNLETQYSKFLSEDLKRAVGICNAVI